MLCTVRTFHPARAAGGDGPCGIRQGPLPFVTIRGLALEEAGSTSRFPEGQTWDLALASTHQASLLYTFYPLPLAPLSQSLVSHRVGPLIIDGQTQV